MTDRRNRSNSLGYTCMIVVVMSHFTGINTTACTDQTDLDKFNHVIRMCGGGSLTNTRVVIDTWDTGNPDTYSCTCTVTLDTKSQLPTTTTITVEEYPGVEPLSNCGSSLHITSTTSSGFSRFGCVPIPATPFNKFGTTDMLNLTLSRADSSTHWQFGHCIYINSDNTNPLDMHFTCYKQSTVSSQSTTNSLRTTTSTVPSTHTTMMKLLTSTRSGERTTSRPSSETTINQSRKTTTYTRETTTFKAASNKSFQEECVPLHQQQGYPLSAVVAPLIVTTLLIGVSLVAHVILYRRRLALVKQPQNTESVTSQPENYASLDFSRVEPPNIYADTSTGQTYVNTALGS